MTLLNGKEVIVSDAALQRLVPLSSFFVVVVQAHGRVIFQHLLLLSEAAGSSLSKKKKKMKSQCTLPAWHQTIDFRCPSQG